MNSTRRQSVSYPSCSWYPCTVRLALISIEPLVSPSLVLRLFCSGCRFAAFIISDQMAFKMIDCTFSAFCSSISLSLTFFCIHSACARPFSLLTTYRIYHQIILMLTFCFCPQNYECVDERQRRAKDRKINATSNLRILVGSKDLNGFFSSR